MGIYVLIRRVEFTDDSADYVFGASESALGRMRVDRHTGEVTLVTPAPDDAKVVLFSRAAFKLRKHWLKGEMPEKTCWAS